MMNHLLTNGTCVRKLKLKNPWNVPHLCPAKIPSKNINKDNINLKNARFATQKMFLMMMEPRQEGQKP